MIQIPKRILADTVTIEEPDTSGHYGDSFLPPRTIDRAYFEPKVSSVSKTWADDKAVSGVLFIDAVNSIGAFSPAVRSRVSVGSFTGTVVEVKEFRPYGRVHHWEVALG